MQEPTRIESNVKPKVFENLGNGNWYYNYDIRLNKVEIPSMENPDSEVTEIRYNYIQVKMRGKPDYKRCVEYIIRAFITQSQEFDLINSYNRAVLQPWENTPEKEKYTEYLSKIQEIKNKIKLDFSE